MIEERVEREIEKTGNSLSVVLAHLTIDHYDALASSTNMSSDMLNTLTTEFHQKLCEAIFDLEGHLWMREFVKALEDRA